MNKVTKFLLYFVSVALLASLAFGEEFTIKDLSAGMWSNPTSNQMPDNAAALIQNFTTDIEPLAVERNGFLKRDTTVLGATATVPGLWAFTDSTGSDWIISYSSRTYYKNTIGTTPTAFGPTTTVNQIPDAAVNLGKIWFTNGTNTVWWFDGTSTSSVSGAPLGKEIEAWRNRLVIGNITGAQSTLRFSEDGNGENWTIGGNPTDPFSVQIGGANDGQNIRCLKGSYLDSLIVGRKYDLWAIDGFDQIDVSLRNISLQVGCIEPRTMQEVDNDLLFLSARGIEAMRGRNIGIISEPIRNVTDVVVKNTISQRSNTQTSQTDFAAGTQDQSRFFSTNIFPGDLRSPFPDTFSNFKDGTGGTPAIWEEYLSGTVTGNVSANGTLNFEAAGNQLGRVNAKTVNTVVDWTMGTTFYIHISSFPKPSSNFNDVFFFTLTSTAAVSPSNPDNAGNRFRIRHSTINETLTDAIVTFDDAASSSTVSNLGLTVPTTVQFWISTTTWQLTVNSSLILRGTHSVTTPQANYLYLGYEKGSLSSATLRLDNMRVQPHHAIFTSQLLNIGSLITAWGPITISDTQTDATLAYQFGSTNTASVSAITNWQTVINGQVPTISTNPYAAFRVFLSTPSPDITNNSFYLSEFVTTWSEGTQTPSPVAWVYDNRYWISFTTASASSPFQDTIFVYQRNKSWTLFKGINAASFTTWRDALYFGNSVANGYVYKFDVGNNDDGSDITSKIITKSYDLGQPFREKDFKRLYCNYLGSSGFTGNFSLSYDIDRYGTPYSLGTVNLSDGNGLASLKFPFPDSQLLRGKEIQYTIIKTGTGDRLRLSSISSQFDTVEER